jgi:hypothetical protein
MADKKIGTGAFARKHNVSTQWVHELVRQGRIKPAPERLEGGHSPYLFDPRAKIVKINEYNT